jgi:uncharacterized protein (DUF433 family)
LLLSALKPGQASLVESLDLVAVAGDTEQRANKLVERASDDLGRIRTNRYVFGNRPVIAGTRIPTAAIWDFHVAGYEADQILDEYPRLVPADVETAIHFEKERRDRVG